MAASISLGLQQLSLEASRRHATVILALDKSGSMVTKHQVKRNIFGMQVSSKTRMETAKEGACKVVDSLSDNDHVAVLAFGSEVDDVCGGAVQLNDSAKRLVKQKVQSIRPGGRTTLYDTIIAGCVIVLQIAAGAAEVGRGSSQDMGTFWLVVVTDGEDTSSKHNLAEVKQFLNRINQELGSQVMQLALIGVALDPRARRCLQEVDSAGGDMTKFVDARNLEDVTAAFDDIAVRLVHRTVVISSGASSGQAQGELLTTGWDGAIQVGSHVRVVGESRGSVPGVDVGDVGVVQGKDQRDGDFVVNFPKRDKWFGRQTDIVLDQEAEKIRSGALVKVKASVGTPSYGWGAMNHGKYGMVRDVAQDGDVTVELPGGQSWKGTLKELTVADDGRFHGSLRGPWPGKLQFGQAVRVPLNMENPSTGWGSLQRGDVGYVKEYRPETESYKCDFPSIDGWNGREQDLEVEGVATMIRPGAKVRVRQGITPAGGWAGVTSSSTGTVKSVRYDGGVVTVQFPEHSSWKGKLSELETLDRPATTRLVGTSATCNCSHGLQSYFTSNYSEKVCDFCGTMSGSPGAQMFGCRNCDIDACYGCHSARSPQPSAPSPPNSPGGSVPHVIPVSPASTVSSGGGKGIPLATAVVADGGEVHEEFPIKSHVVINGLTSTAGSQYNGKEAEVQAKLPDSMYMVQILGDGGPPKKLKACYLSKTHKHPAGTIVYIKGIKADPFLNGEVGTISGFDGSKGRYIVTVAGRTVSLLPENVDPIPDVEELS